MSDSGAENNKRDNFAVSPMPFSADVEYYAIKQIALYVTNISSSDQLVEMVTLQFQTDSGASPIYLEHTCGVQIPINKAAPINVRIRPTPLYRDNTNSFGVMVHYRTIHGARLEAQRTDELHPNCSYLILRLPPTTLSGVFISFKQPENLTYAELLYRYAQRAGFQPYLVKSDPRPGTDQWNRIENAIRQCEAAFIVWTSRTRWGTGVEKEIELCRKYNVKEILLIENDLGLPVVYQDTALEYSTFDPLDPGPQFCEAVNALRQDALKSI